MLFVTDFADQAVMLPLATVVLLVFGVMGWGRGALAWLVAVGSTFAMILALKSGLVILSADYGSDYLISPSGHVASACVVYGGIVLLLGRGVLPNALIAAVPVATAFVVGYSRVALSAHTVGEVVAGGLVGCAGLGILAMAAGPRPRLPAWPLAAAGGCTVLALHGMHLPAEAAIRYASLTW